MEERYYQNGQVTLHYDAAGNPKNQPILLLHGFASSSDRLSGMITTLQREYMVYALDLRGHGLSGRTPNCYRLEDFAQDVVSFLEHVIRRDAVIYGYSLGAMVAMLAASMAPIHVQGVIARDCPMNCQALKRYLQQKRHIIDCRRIWSSTLTVDSIFNLLKQINQHGEYNIPREANVPLEHDMFQLARNIKHSDPNLFSLCLDQFDEICRPFIDAAVFSTICCPLLILKGNGGYPAIFDETSAIQTAIHCPSIDVMKLDCFGNELDRQSIQQICGIIDGFIQKHFGEATPAQNHKHL